MRRFTHPAGVVPADPDEATTLPRQGRRELENQQLVPSQPPWGARAVTANLYLIPYF